MGDSRDKGDRGDSRDRGDMGDSRDKGDRGDSRDKGDSGDWRDKGDRGDRGNGGARTDGKDKGDQKDSGGLQLAQGPKQHRHGCCNAKLYMLIDPSLSALDSLKGPSPSSRPWLQLAPNCKL